MRRVFVFPGQGSQSVGMLAELAAQRPRRRSTPLPKPRRCWATTCGSWCSRDPPSSWLKRCTQQPAMLAAGVATWRYWRGLGGAAPDVVCGHSLGEFTALVAAGALDFRAAVQLVRGRAELMQEAVPAGVGAIAAVLGLEDDADRRSLPRSRAGRGRRAGELQLARPGGDRRPCRGRAARAGGLQGARARSARVLLPMSVPAHSSLMRPAAEHFAALLAAAPQCATESRTGVRWTAPQHSTVGRHPRAAAPAAGQPGALVRSDPRAGRRGCHDVRRMRTGQGAHRPRTVASTSVPSCKCLALQDPDPRCRPRWPRRTEPGMNHDCNLAGTDGAGHRRIARHRPGHRAATGSRPARRSSALPPPRRVRRRSRAALVGAWRARRSARTSARPDRWQR